MEYEVIHGIYDLPPNVTLDQIMQANLEAVGGVDYDASEQEFARTIRTTLPDDALPMGSQAHVQTLTLEGGISGSTDVIEQAWTEHRERRGADYVYVPLVGDRDPPLDYRLPASAGR